MKTVSAPDAIASAREELRQAAPEAARQLVTIMRSGTKDDLVQRQAANDILSMNGISPTKPREDSTAKIAGAAVLAAILGMAKVSGLRGITPETFKKLLKQEDTDTSSLPPELLSEQDALR